MRALFSQFSGLIGILTFINQMLGGAPVEKAVLTGAGSGLAVYVVLLLGDVVIQRILEQAAAAPQSPARPTAQPGASKDASAEANAKDAKAA
ncbi:MAG: hypothetical protein JJ896_12350 [Rhodothermales bacterium]|nr:hypothetical protein [Rhodothermales bacterium]MBO6780436.1 hypothetical protein [Rhodothermales bacterium]